MVVQESYGHLNNGNVPALLENLSDDVQWVVPGEKTTTPWAGSYKGKKEIGDFFRQLNRGVESLNISAREFIEQGNRVIALGRSENKSKTAEKSNVSDWAMAFTLKDGKVTHVQEYGDAYSPYSASGEHKSPRHN